MSNQSIIEYVKVQNFRPKDECKFISGVKVDRIYKVLGYGPDYFKISANGKPVYIESWACHTSNRQEYLEQDRPRNLIEEEEERDYQEVLDIEYN